MYYIPQEGIGEVETTPVKLYSRGGDIVVEGAAGARYGCTTW